MSLERMYQKVLSFLHQDKKLCLTGHIPGKDFPYSDHEGVEASFALEQREKPLEVQERVLDGACVCVCVCVHMHVCVVCVSEREAESGSNRER